MGKPAHTTHDRAAILSTGDEIVIGQTQDSNAKLLAGRLIDIGIMPIEHAAVGDEIDSLVGAIRRLAAKVPLLVMSGGLGPTEGDLTRAALAKILDEPLVTDDGAMEALRTFLSKRGREMSERQARQAQRPRSAVCLPNLVGTAPGLHVVLNVTKDDGTRGECDVFCLPGPPRELEPMLTAQVLPRLRPPTERVVGTRLLHVVGIAEADAVNRLGDLTKRTPGKGQDDALVGITASGGVLTLRMRATSATRAGVDAALGAAEKSAHASLGDHVVGMDASVGREALARGVIERLIARSETVCTIESCTGGLLGGLLTMIAGSSAAYVGGAVTYSNDLKKSLAGVNAKSLEQFGAVSEAVAKEMAVGGLARFGAKYALAITGIAGPDGGSSEKPVGTVFVALASNFGTRREGHGVINAHRDGINDSSVQQPRVDVRRLWITGDREEVRQRACTSALAMLHFAMMGRAIGEPRLVWEKA